MNTPQSKHLQKILLAVFDFDGVFTDNRVLVSEDGNESVFCCRSDGLGLKRLREAGVQAFILSMEKNPVVSRRAKKLEIECFQGVNDKLDVLKKETTRRGLCLDQVAFVGNDINDADCLGAVGLPVLVGDAWPEVRASAQWMLTRNGGQGAVREFCDAIWSAKKVRQQNKRARK